MDCNLSRVDLSVIEVALRGNEDIRRYAPEVLMLCEKLGLPEPDWFDTDQRVRERLGRPDPEQ